jgi:hypothetical protein
MSPRLSRRDVLKLAAAGVLSGSGVPWFRAMAQEAAQQPRRPKSCILLWMDGGVSQAHTFDPKPGGEYPSRPTTVPGIRVCEYLPRLAAQMGDIALLRGMNTGEGDHYRAKYLLHTGYPRVGSFEHPALGCIASSEIGRRDHPLPNFVTIDAGFDKVNGGRLYRSVPAYLGVRHSPLAVADPDKGLENLTSNDDAADFAAQLDLLRRSERRFASDYAAPAVTAQQDAFNRALQLMTSNRARAFNLDSEPLNLRERYGNHKFGKACLMARRLVEAGVSFIEIFHRGWDDHEGAGRRVHVRCPWMDAGMSTLIADLKDRGLLDDTLIVWMSEFGRSPVRGTDHFSRAWTTLLAGGGLRTGQAVGRTDERGNNPGGTIVDRPINASSFIATICQTLGIEIGKELIAPGDRPMRLVDRSGVPIQELF